MIAVVGANGQVGSAIAALLGPSATPFTRADFDVTDRRAMRTALAGAELDAIFNCAAYTAVDRAENDRDLAFAVNAAAAAELASVAADLGVPFVTFSTDYVFDGTKGAPYVESDEPNPLNVYGSSKLAGERLVLDAHADALVIRTSWVLSGSHPNFAATIVDRAKSGPVHVVDDQFGRPTIASDLARASLAALDARASGILHLTNTPTVSWFTLARDCVDFAGLDPALVEPRTTAAVPDRAHRPSDGSLDSERIAGFGLDPMPPYREALAGVIAQLTGGAEGPVNL